MLMCIYLRNLLEYGGARRRMNDLQTLMYRNEVMAACGICVPHESFQPRLGETHSRAEREVQLIFVTVCVVPSGSKCVCMPDRKLA
jgi:hypothetical protein